MKVDEMKETQNKKKRKKKRAVKQMDNNHHIIIISDILVYSHFVTLFFINSVVLL